MRTAFYPQPAHARPLPCVVAIIGGIHQRKAWFVFGLRRKEQSPGADLSCGAGASGVLDIEIAICEGTTMTVCHQTSLFSCAPKITFSTLPADSLHRTTILGSSYVFTRVCQLGKNDVLIGWRDRWRAANDHPTLPTS